MDPVDGAVLTGQRIRALRRERGMSQQALAEPELSASYLSRIESGDRLAPPSTLQLLAERLGVSAALLATGVSEDQRAAFRMQLESASYALATGDLGTALAAERGLRAAADELGEPAQALAVDALVARAQEQSGADSAALSLWRDLLTATTCPTPLWCEAAVASVRLGRQLGDVSRAVETGERLLAELDATGSHDTPEAVRLLLTVMSALLARGDIAHAALLGEDAQRRAAVAADGLSLGRAYWNTSHVLLEQGKTDAAAELAGRAVACLTEAAQPREAALVQVLRGQFLTLLGRQTEARGLLQEASATLAVVGTTTDLVYLHLEFARAALADGETTAVHEHVSHIAADGSAAPVLLAEAQLLGGRADLGAGHRESGLQRLRRAAELLASSEVSRHGGRAWAELAEGLDEAGDVVGARDAYRAAAACLGLIARPLTAAPVR